MVLCGRGSLNSYLAATRDSSMSSNVIPVTNEKWFTAGDKINIANMNEAFYVVHVGPLTLTGLAEAKPYTPSGHKGFFLDED